MNEWWLCQVPDGVADEESSFLLLENGDESVCHDGALTLRNSSSASTSIDLRNPISCYICHKPYTQLHFFYHQLCPDCAAFNYLKRTESADLSGRMCLVTGGRTKIGFRCALKLLRCGASVIVTTRFPVDAASRYTAEKDCPQWMDRLQVYGLDFRDLSRLEAFCCHLEQNYDRLDVIINNAAQTVRRPPAYYAHLLEAERIDFTAPEETTQSDEGPSSISRMKQALRGQHQFSDNFSRTIEGGFRKALTTSSEHGTDGSRADEVTGRILTREAPEIMSSAQMTQLPLIPGEEIQAGEAFPAALTDINGQQIDLRRQNSWTMRLNEVPTVELAEVFAINTIAPTIINSRLKAMLLRRPCTAPDGSDSHSSNKKKGNAGKYSHPDSWKFIVNVSAMEGKFYRYKSDAHPHTNMAKAALNMMTRTSAQDYVKSGIYMTAVDTGWINDEKPIELAMAHEKTHNFQTPLDEVDAAARVLDPVIAPLRAAQDLRDSSSHGIGGTDSSSGSSSGTIIVEPPWGYFLKDYVKTEW
ncbi:unnamed protein product [Symbiodinium microadriaticum]|nr:unnamed protein product [Symbiodinium microadriaticum]